MPSGMILYHGTSERYLKTILRKGLLPRRLTGNGNWTGNVASKDDMVYLTDAYPVYFAAGPAFDDQTGLLILKVNVDESQLYPDEDFVAWALASGLDGIRQEELNPLIHPSEYKDAWRLSLDLNGIVCTPSVPSDRILGQRVIPQQETELIAELGLDPMPTPLNYRQFGVLYRRCLELLFELGTEAVLKEIRQR